MHALRLSLVILAVLAAIGTVVAGASGSTFAALLLGIGAGWAVCAAVLSWDLGWGLVLTSLGGGGVSAYLLRQHVLVLDGGVSICSINQVFDCDAVNTSRWSEMFGIPVALWGLAFYVAVAVGSALWRLGRKGYREAPWVLLLMAIGSLFYSLWLAWISHFRIHSWCLFCISMYGVNVLLLIGSCLAVRRERQAPRPRLWPLLWGSAGDRTARTVVLAGLAALFVGGLSWQGLKQSILAEANADDTLPIGIYTAPGPVEVSGFEPVFGKPDAPYMIVEWADFQCPYCARASAEIKTYIQTHPDVQLRFKDYPISSRCNPEVSSLGHRTSCDASFAAKCAHAQGRFWEYADLLMKNQAYQSPEDLRFIAGQIQLDMDAFQACMGSDTPERAVRVDVTAAARVEVNATPTFYVKGLYGDDFVQFRGRPEALFRLLDTHRKGRPMPEPQPPPPDEWE
ncbi:MAG: thioredoxin domain-containing protein [Deltaproteobacteria bacterium]|nr:thioredoxin domain-containing protein [Deltaproteobacteria bacterium]